MQPIKDKSLHYFIIEDKGFSKKFQSYKEYGMGYDDNSTFSSVVHLLKLFKKDELDELFIQLGPREHKSRIYQWLDTSGERPEFKQGHMNGDYAVKLPIKVKYVEEVKYLKPYAGSVEFTIGSSKRKEESSFVLVGVDIDWSHADKQIERFNELNKGLEMKLDELFMVDAVFQKAHLSPIGDYTRFSHGGFYLEEPILGKGYMKGRDVRNYTYDDLYKYYTLL